MPKTQKAKNSSFGFPQDSAIKSMEVINMSLDHDTMQGYICPITKKAVSWAWTSHTKPGLYNSCQECEPVKYKNGISSLLLATKKARIKKDMGYLPSNWKNL